ncbi:hypothetical protein, partial [Chromatium okenii]|uniref:hypothetical protein n=1 Tax=Chromatium okenii TaxID=61644 RepID=UPI0026E9D221
HQPEMSHLRRDISSKCLAGGVTSARNVTPTPRHQLEMSRCGCDTHRTRSAPFYQITLKINGLTEKSGAAQILAQQLQNGNQETIRTAH